MRTLEARLADQNQIATWRDCNAAGFPHRWFIGHVVDGTDSVFWRCKRCPIDTRTLGGRPERFLG